MSGLKQVIWSVIAAGCLAMPVHSQTETIGQIHVNVTPEGASLTCNGQPTSSTPTTLNNMPEGDYLLVATKSGYQEARQTVSILAGQRVNVEMTLEPITGLIVVHTDPPGASIEINGAYYGETPLLLTDLALGTYRMKLSAQGCRTREVPIELKDRTPRKILVELESDAGSLTVDSNPEGANLILNGIAKGTTPCTVDRVPEGDTTLQLTLDGYKTYNHSVRLTAGQTETIQAVLEPLPAMLTIVTRPTGARIYVENQFRGTAPVTLKALPPGEYRVRAEKEGCEMMARTVELELGQELTEEFRLSGNTGTIELSTEPSDVTVYVDGQETGLTAAKESETDRVSEPFLIEQLAEGRHQIQLSKKGYKGESFFVKIERDETAAFHKKLIKLFIPDCEIVTKNAIYKGVFIEETPDGTIKLETHPGVIRNFPASEILFRRPIREQ
ncbi:MAG: PEGA domain-containing protein [Kiritimatiellae bacterium]|nr:PEGA domain-containing protein [Kiritimatiellia bacterium]